MIVSPPNLLLRTLLLLSLALALNGCSVRYDKNGKMLFNPDLASVLGNEVGQFTLADGSKGALRELNGRYSLKWSNLMIERPLEGVSWVRIINQYQVEGHTLLLLGRYARLPGAVPSGRPPEYALPGVGIYGHMRHWARRDGQRG